MYVASNYRNSIVLHSKRKDRARDEQMKSDEFAKAMAPATSDRLVLQRKYGTTGWVPYYLFVIRRRLKQELAAAHVRIEQGAPAYVTHLSRRLIAFFHQELELWSQGERAWNAASEEGTLIMYGCS